MLPKYRRMKDLTQRQRQRAVRILIGALVLRSILQSLAVWIGFFYVEMEVAKVTRPNVDVNGWRFFWIAYPVSCIVGCAAMAFTHVLLIRWLLRFRTARRGRAVALRNVLRPTDHRASRLRRWRLALYGVANEELVMSPSVWRPSKAEI